jgi:nucleotide-binding universal stress UspA family protein
MIAIQDVLVATDFSPASERALTYGRALARTFGGRLHVLHVVDNMAVHLAFGDASAALAPFELQTEIEKAARQDLDRSVTESDRRDLRAVTVLRVDTNPSQAIATYAAQADIDLVVIGATGRGAVNRLLTGSVADKVIRRAPCPVLTVHHPEHEFLVPEAVQAPTTAAG